jgi:ubiquinone/menaquinone biosynthesis C-methylase UbiE
MMTKPLTAEEWGGHYNTSLVEGLMAALRQKEYSWQTQQMLELTSVGESVLEVGSGTGATSLALALSGRKATALDFAQPCLDLAVLAATRLECPIDVVLADATQELPFEDSAFDWVFQAGLLEHFERETRVQLLKNWGRVASRMVSIIPNAASIAYRYGKARMEKNGSWPYGLELPQYSLKNEFLEAGYKVTDEFTIGEEHSLTFLPRWHPLRQILKWWIKQNDEDNCGQGYLLVTIGERI